MSDPRTAVVRAEGLGKTYAEGSLRTPVFDGLDFEVHAGETVAVLGASGAGKSTLLHLLGGLDTPTVGEVYVDGQKMSALSDAARGLQRNRALGFVYQFHHLLPEFTALENVMLPVLLGGASIPDATSHARELLESVGLAHRLEHKPGELSGGERQRVAIARALANDPAILLADEPTGNLDSRNSDAVVEHFRRLAHDDRRAVVCVTHDLEIAALADRRISMLDGRIVDVDN